MTFDDLVTVNAKVNLLPYKTDPEMFGKPDWWSDICADGAGDCDSYAIGKLRRLLDRGWPISALRLACCYVETGEYHAVLLADYEGQTWVLDNRHKHPMEFQLLPYKWDRLQIAGSMGWEMA